MTNANIRNGRAQVECVHLFLNLKEKNFGMTIKIDDSNISEILLEVQGLNIVLSLRRRPVLYHKFAIDDRIGHF